MANTLLRNVARLRISRRILDQSAAPVMCTGRTCRKPSYAKTHYHLSRYVSTKGITQRAGISTEIKEESADSDTDYDSDDEKKVGFFHLVDIVCEHASEVEQKIDRAKYVHFPVHRLVLHNAFLSRAAQVTTSQGRAFPTVVSGRNAQCNACPTDDSPFWRRKMRTLHNHLDVNKDGVISYEDFMLLTERFSELGHLSVKAKVEFKKVVIEMWKEQWGDVSPYNLICVEKYLEEMHHVLHDKSLRQKYHEFLPFLFKAIDKDQSGQISVEEFKLFFKCLGLSQDNAVIAFSHIDINGDGKISFEEFIKLGREFFLTRDENKPSKYFWGPMVD